MSHKVVLKALEFPVVGRSRRQQIFAFLTAQRQLFNSLAPILPSMRSLIPQQREPVFRFLMRADTFRFATSLLVQFDMTTALVRELLSKMDFVVEVEISSKRIGDELTTTLMALPHLERVVISHLEPMTYNGTLRPLLKHPRESVRRSVALSTSSNWFDNLATPHFFDAVRQDIIPLIDSASCNGAILDYLRVVQSAAAVCDSLPRDIIMMLGERLFQFFTAANSHAALVEKSLKLLSGLAADGIPGEESAVVDVFKEWPVLESLSDMIRSGAVLPENFSLGAVIRRIFCQEEFVVRAASTTLLHHQQRLFDLQLADIIYDSYFARAGSSSVLSPLFRSLQTNDLFSSFALSNPVAFLTKTKVCKAELQRDLIPWHRDVMAQMLRHQRRGEPLFSFCGELLIEFDRYDFYRRTPAADFILRDLLFPMFRSTKPSETLQVLHLLFDENELNIGPVLRSYLTFARDNSVPNYRSREPDKYPCGDDIICSLFFVARDICVNERQRRRDRDDGAGTIRSYFSEFLASLDPALHCRLCGRSAFRAPTADT